MSDINNKPTFAEFFAENTRSFDLISKVVEIFDFIFNDEYEDYSVSGAVEERFKAIQDKFNVMSNYYNLDEALRRLDYDYLLENIPNELFFVKKNKETALMLPRMYNIKGTLKAIRWFLEIFGVKNYTLTSWWEANEKYLSRKDPLYSKITPPHIWRISVYGGTQDIDPELELKFFEFMKKFVWVNISDIEIWFLFSGDDWKVTIDSDENLKETLLLSNIANFMFDVVERNVNDELELNVNQQINDDIIYSNMMGANFPWNYYSKYFPKLDWYGARFTWDSGVYPTSFSFKEFFERYPEVRLKDMDATTYGNAVSNFVIDSVSVVQQDVDWNYILGKWSLGVLPFKGSVPIVTP